jgi:prevent-host-death family protein
MRTATIEEARAKLGDAVDLARLAGEPTMITRHGRPAAVVVGAEWFREAQECLTRTPGASNVPSGGSDDH